MSSKPSRKPSRERELADLCQRFGEPKEQWLTITRKNLTTGPAGFPLSSRRTAEVVLVVPRANGKVLVHTKRFYPAGIWRLPTGGLRRRETIESAVRREVVEETGLALAPARFLFHLHFRWDGLEKNFQSYGFLMTEAHGEIHSQDRREQIAAFRESDRPGILDIAEHLSSLRGSWSSWGLFRAAPHRVLLDLWPQEGDLRTAGPER